MKKWIYPVHSSGVRFYITQAMRGGQSHIVGDSRHKRDNGSECYFPILGDTAKRTTLVKCRENDQETLANLAYRCQFLNEFLYCFSEFHEGRHLGLGSLRPE